MRAAKKGMMMAARRAAAGGQARLWWMRVRALSQRAVPGDASDHTKQGIPNAYRSHARRNLPSDAGAGGASSLRMATRSAHGWWLHGARPTGRGQWWARQEGDLLPQPSQQGPAALVQSLRRYHDPAGPAGGGGLGGGGDEGDEDNDMAQLTDHEVEDMLQMSQLPMFLPTVENRPPPANSLEVLRNLSPMALFSWLHRGAFDANDFVAGVKVALPELGHAIRERDLERLDAMARPPLQDNIKLTFEVMQHAVFEYDIEEVNRVRLDCVHVEDLWNRESPLTIDVWADVTERFVVARPTDGAALHPRMHRPFRCVRRYRFASTPGDETTRTWCVQHMLGPNGFPPRQASARFWF